MFSVLAHRYSFLRLASFSRSASIFRIIPIVKSVRSILSNARPDWNSPINVSPDIKASIVVSTVWTVRYVNANARIYPTPLTHAGRKYFMLEEFEGSSSHFSLLFDMLPPKMD